MPLVYPKNELPCEDTFIKVTFLPLIVGSKRVYGLLKYLDTLILKLI